MGDIFINDVFVGSCNDSKKFVNEFRKNRREGKFNLSYNISHYDELNFIYIENTPGRVRRPLIVVKDGISMLKKMPLLSKQLLRDNSTLFCSKGFRRGRHV